MSAQTQLLLDAVRRAINPPGGEQPQPVVVVRPKGEGVAVSIGITIGEILLAAWVVMLCLPVALPHVHPGYWRVIVGLIGLRETAALCRPAADSWSISASAWRKSGRSL